MKSWVPLFSHALMPTGTSHRSPTLPRSQLLSVLPDCDHPSGNRSISCPRESQTPPQPPVPARSERATSLPPSFPHLHLRHVGGLPPSPPLASPSSFGRSAGASAINHGLSGSGGKRTGGGGPCGGAAAAAGARERRRRARSLAPSRPASLQLVNRSPREKRRDRGSDCSIRMRSFRTASLRCGARDISA